MTFSRIIARLANLSFGQGNFPAKFKTAQITPLLKKIGMDDADPVNYHPIFNLNTISKILELLFLRRILPHESSSPNYNQLQSAYRRSHSTETALLKMTDDIYTAMDSSQSTIMIALDMSAAFDMIDHDVLQRLQNTFGIGGTAPNWIRSLLHDRHSYVKRASGQSATSTSAYRRAFP